MAVPILGIPLAANPSYLRAAAQAPPQIREALFSQSRNLYSEMGIDLGASESLFDAGDLQLGRTPTEDFAAIESGADELLQRGTPVIFLGGHRTINIHLIKACHRNFPELSI